jgi:hypothetical protein
MTGVFILALLIPVGENFLMRPLEYYESQRECYYAMAEMPKQKRNRYACMEWNDDD